MKNNLSDIFQTTLHILVIIILAYASFFILNLQFNSADVITKIALTPFVLCFFYTVGLLIAKVLKNDKYVNLFTKSYILTFLLFWFLFLGIVLFNAIKDNNLFLIIYTIPFFITGIFIFKICFIKGKK